MFTKTSPDAPPPHGRRGFLLAAIATVLAGFALLAVGAYFLLNRTFTDRSFGTIEPPAKSAASTDTSTASDTPAAKASKPAATQPVDAFGPPAWLDLPTLHVRARVENVVTHSGILAVPDDPAKVGWWTGSVPAGSVAGSTVLDGHVDSAVTGTGALFALTRLAAGDAVSITTATGHVVHYAVTGRRIYTKHQALPPDLFATTGPPRLVLITCGGPFDASTRSYEDNIVVFAAPVT